MSNLAERPQGQPRNGVRALITAPAYQARFAEMLKDRAPQFITSVTSQCASGPLAQVQPESVIAAAFIAATLDLPVDRNLGFAWIVPYKGVAQFQMGYRGYVQLAFRTGQYRRMNAVAINAEALNGFDYVGEPIIDFTLLDEDQPAAGYALMFELVNGFRKTIYWSKAKVEKHAKRYSQSYGRGANSPWTTNFDDMALKTVIANGLKKWGILSIEMQKAYKHDQGAQIDIDAEVSFPDGHDMKQLEVPTGKVGATPIEQAARAATKPTAPAKAQPEAEHAFVPRGTPTPVEEGPTDEETDARIDGMVEKAIPIPSRATAKGPSQAELAADITNRLAPLNIGKMRFITAAVEQGYLASKTNFGDIPAEVLQAIVDGWEDFAPNLAPQE